LFAGKRQDMGKKKRGEGGVGETIIKTAGAQSKGKRRVVVGNNTAEGETFRKKIQIRGAGQVGGESGTAVKLHLRKLT